MRSHQSIHIPLRLDRSRKALMAQLSANIAKNASAATPKRSKAQQYDGLHDLQTMKKKQHIDVNSQDKKQNAKLIKQNDRKFCTQKQIPIKPNSFSDPKFIASTQKKSSKINNNQEYFDTNFQPFKPADLNLMLDNKIFNLGSLSIQDNKLFSEKERLLISIQEKLDSHLMFLKEHRKKKRGELFSIIKKTFLENYRIFLEFSHIKKILYISENFYSIQKFGDGLSVDCLVDIKLSCKQTDQKALESQMNERKNEFRSKLFCYKENIEGNSNTKQFDIPEVKFQFEEDLENKKNVLKSSMKQLFDGQLIKKKKIDRFFVLQNKNSTAYEQSKKNLQKGMKKVESIIKKEKQLDLGMFTNKIFEKRLLNEKEIRKIINEIAVIYRDKSVMNMIENQLIEGLSKKLILSQCILRRVVEIFLELSPRVSRNKPFLSCINHKMGKLIRIDSSMVKQFETRLVSNEQWMKLFEFQIEMNGEYLKGKMQQQRDRLYQQLQNEENERNGLCSKKQDEKGAEIKLLVQEQHMNEIQAQRTVMKQNQQAQDKNVIKVNELNRNQHLAVQKDQFNSTLSNSEQLYYDEAKC